MSMWLLHPSMVLVGSLMVSQASATAPVAAGASQSVSTTITSKKMTVRNHDSQAIFEGAVILTRGTLVVYSDRMVVSFGSQESNTSEKPNDREASQRKGPETVGNRAVNKIEATGRVKIERDNGNATCDKAIYYREEDKIVLTGSPVAWEKGTRVSGRQITMFLGEDRSVVEGGSHVMIEPDGGMK